MRELEKLEFLGPSSGRLPSCSKASCRSVIIASIVSSMILRGLGSLGSGFGKPMEPVSGSTRRVCRAEGGDFGAGTLGVVKHCGNRPTSPVAVRPLLRERDEYPMLTGTWANKSVESD